MTPYKIHLKENRKRRIIKKIAEFKMMLKHIAHKLIIANANNEPQPKLKEQGKELRAWINRLKNRYEELI